jgi:hypothetical protein
VVIKADPTIKFIFDYKFSPTRHDPDLGIKKVITPTFMPLKTRKWFNNHSLFSDESLSLRKSRDENS